MEDAIPANDVHNLDKRDSDHISKSSELSSQSDSDGSQVVYQGPVFHTGINRLGHHFCHARYLRIRGNVVEMFKKEPKGDRKPIRKGVVGQFMKVEELGRKNFDEKELYVLKISSAIDDTKKGEIAFNTAAEAQKWMHAFQQAKEVACEFKGSGNKFLDDKEEFNLSKHRHSRLRSYAHGFTKLMTIGRGSDYLFGRGSKSRDDSTTEPYTEKREDDTLEQQDWRCVRLENGIRILEDVSAYVEEGAVVLKSIGVIEASPSVIFEMLMDLKNPHRKEWDILTGDLKLVSNVDGHTDIVYGTFDPKYLRRWNSKRDFLFSRVWRHDPDNTYTIIMSSTMHKDYPKREGFRRITLNPSIWEIKPLPFNKHSSSRSLVSQTMGIRSTGWGRWKKKYYTQLEKTIPYIVLCQIAGLRDYVLTNLSLHHEEVSMTAINKDIKLGITDADVDSKDEFYDAIAAEEPDEENDEDSDDDEDERPKKKRSQRFRAIAFGVMGLTPHARAKVVELVSTVESVHIDLEKFKGSLPMAVRSTDTDCWSDPGGKEFMVRGKTYLTDFTKVSGGDPLLKLLAMDWLKSDNRIDFVSSNKSNLVQSEAGKQLPFILVVNLQVPATPNYSLIFYFGATRPILKGSLLDRFANGNDTFRDSRFKLIPRIVEGYWFVKRAVGTKACLLGKAVTCRYLRQDNFLEIDVDIGSSSVARSIINLVLGHVTSIVVDMAVLIEGKEEDELPEYLLGTTRINRVRPESALLYL